MAESTIVSSNIQNADRCTSSTYFWEISTTPASTSTGTAAHVEEDKFAGLSLSVFLTENSRLSEEATGNRSIVESLNKAKIPGPHA